MTTTKLSIVATTLLSLALCGPALAAQALAHHAVAAPSTSTTGTRWKTNAALREGMARIRREVLGLEHYQHGHIGPQQAVILAGDVERDVGFVVAHCMLASKADAALPDPGRAGARRAVDQGKSRRPVGDCANAWCIADLRDAVR